MRRLWGVKSLRGPGAGSQMTMWIMWMTDWRGAAQRQAMLAASAANSGRIAGSACGAAMPSTRT